MWFKKKTVKKTFDRTKKVPAIRSSICTGEKVAGFKMLDGSRFEEIMLIRNEADLQAFKEMYDINEEIKTFY